MTIISLNSPRLRFTGVEISNPQTTVIRRGINAIIGPNGSGKTTLGRIIEGGWNFMTNDISTPLDHKPHIRTIEFSDIHSLTSFKVEYYQQRFEASMNDEVPTVANLMADRIHTDVWRKMSGRLGLDKLLNKRMNYVSSGELRKLLITNMLFELPDVLIIDNPYIGLDAESRTILNETLHELAISGLTIILLICNPDELCDIVDTIIPIKDMTIGPESLSEEYTRVQITDIVGQLFDYGYDVNEIPLRDTPYADTGAEMVNLNGCRVQYGNNVLLDNVSWNIRQGEAWSLSGPNGSGKSTLLSLINADNPQSYANDIRLFGQKRGTGESIWDIKNRIGFVSPEMHLYFRAGNNTSIEVLAGGLNDTLGCYRQIPQWQLDAARRWIRLLHIEYLTDRRFNNLSFGEQRIILLARALIKNPELLILDEPLHGLDAGRKFAVRKIINHIVCSNHCTLIYVTHYTHELPECITNHRDLGER